MSLVEIFVKPVHEPGSHLEGVDGADTGNNALGEGVGLAENLQDSGFVASFYSGHDAHDDDCRGGNAQTDECELPLDNKGDDEGRDKGGQSLERETELLCDAALNQASIGGSLRGNRAAGAKVVKGDFLAKSSSKIGMADVSYNAVG